MFFKNPLYTSHHLLLDTAHVSFLWSGEIQVDGFYQLQTASDVWYYDLKYMHETRYLVT